MNPVMNDAKWRELQRAMSVLKCYSPQWRVKHLDNDVVSSWDGDWSHHFSEGGFKNIEWVEIKTETEEQTSLVLSGLRKVHVSGEQTAKGFKVYGYVQEGCSIECL